MSNGAKSKPHLPLKDVRCLGRTAGDVRVTAVVLVTTLPLSFFKSLNFKHIKNGNQKGKKKPLQKVENRLQ